MPQDEEKEASITGWKDANLRRVCDEIPITIFLVAVAELAERFTYRCITAPMQNYLQNPRGDDLRPGALGRGQSVATGVNYFFTGWCFLAPIIGAIVADTYLGRFRTICLGTCLEHGAGMPGLMVALVLIGLGSGGIKSNVAPLIAEQYSGCSARIQTLDDGEKVVVDPNVTTQTIFNRYFWVINIGSLSVIPASLLELNVDFWAAFLLPLCFSALAVAALVAGRSKYVVQKPHGSIIVNAARTLWISIKNNGHMDAAKPSNGANVPWDDIFVEELKRALVACRVFLAFPIFWICYGQTNSNLVSQAGTMNTYGVPNDIMGCFNPIMILILLPLMYGLERVVYPTLRRLRIQFKPITRITAGFIVMACAIAYAAVLQDVIYKSPPCYDHPLAEECSDGGQISNNVNVFLQVPVYAMTALAEVWAFVAGMEYAYTKAPKSMRSIVSSLFLLMCALGSTMGIALSPVSDNPKILVQYACLSGTMVVTAFVVFVLFGKYNQSEEKMNMLEVERDDE
ncbi:hypothetical protein AWENTII_000123 [Aspergillus wentii]